MCHGQKSRFVGDGNNPTSNTNPYNGYINPYYWVDDHPLLYGNSGSLDSTCARTNLRSGDASNTGGEVMPQGRKKLPQTKKGVKLARTTSTINHKVISQTSANNRKGDISSSKSTTNELSILLDT